MKKSWIKRGTSQMKRTKLKARGTSETSVIKEKIQAILREIVIIRDGGCIFRDCLLSPIFYGLPQCNGYRKDGELILQADHLITRSNSATYADTRLVVCVCKGHHGWKSVGSNLHKAQYDEVVKMLLSKERVELWEKCERESWRPTRTGVYDWKLALVALEQELNKLKN